MLWFLEQGQAMWKLCVRKSFDPKKAIYKAIFLNEEEINKLRDIANSGVYIDMQVIPEDTKSDLMKMIK